MKAADMTTGSQLLKAGVKALEALRFTSGEGLDHYNAVNRLHLLRDRALELGLKFVEVKDSRGIVIRKLKSKKRKQIRP